MDYRDAFREALEKVRGEGRYRVFADLKRRCGEFPRATWTRPDGSAQEVVVWCSNDYLGQGQNPVVLEAMKAENVSCRPPAGSVILPVQAYIEKKLTAHRNWPTWTVGRGKTVQYGADSCPRTIDIHNRFAGVSLNPGLSEADCDDVVAAIRKVFPAV